MGIENCAGIADPELMRMCEHLAGKIQGLTIQPWITALIGIIGALLAASLAAVGTFLLQRADRRNSSQRKALEAAQDTARKLRNKWIAFQSDRQLFPDNEQTKLSGILALHLSRISSKEVVKAFEDWSSYAQLFYTGFEQFQAFEEDDRWRTSLALSGDELKKLD